MTGRRLVIFDMVSRTNKAGKARATACRQHAALNARAALAATDPDIKVSYRDLAMQWRELAALFDDLENWAA
jgi:hypothetical protein